MKQRGRADSRCDSGRVRDDAGSETATETRQGHPILVLTLAAALVFAYAALLSAAFQTTERKSEVNSVLSVLVEEPDPAGRDSKGRTDTDGDGVADATDNCLFTPNPSQDDSNRDGIGNACDCGTAGSDTDHCESEADCLGVQ